MSDFQQSLPASLAHGVGAADGAKLAKQRREPRFAARSVVGGCVNVANLPDHGSIRKRCSGRDDRIGASGESALISRGSKQNFDCVWRIATRFHLDDLAWSRKFTNGYDYFGRNAN